MAPARQNLLLLLPAEIRLTIYRKVYESAIFETPPGLRSWQFASPRVAQYHQQYFGLLHTGRNIRTEAQPVFLQTALFVFRSTHSIAACISLLGIENMRLIARVQFPMTGVVRVDAFLRGCGAGKGLFPNLRTLVLQENEEAGMCDSMFAADEKGLLRRKMQDLRAQEPLDVMLRTSNPPFTVVVQIAVVPEQIFDLLAVHFVMVVFFQQAAYYLEDSETGEPRRWGYMDEAEALAAAERSAAGHKRRLSIEGTPPAAGQNA